jgi:hypothetical protein
VLGNGQASADKPYSFRAMLSQWEVADPFYRWSEGILKIKRVALISPNDTSGSRTPTPRSSRRSRASASRSPPT